MDKIAVISDIHGNIPALESVLNDIKNKGIKRIFCLGDLAGKGPSSDIAIDMIRENCEVVVKGNWDYFISEQNDREMLLYHRNKIGEDRINYLKSLPIYKEFYLSGKLVRICHASPFDVMFRVYKTAEDDMAIKLFQGTKENSDEADIIGYGDIHDAYLKNFRGKTIFNVGSVGNPLDITEASYAVIEGEYENIEKSSYSISLVRVPYDIEKSVEQARKSNMPDLEYYIKELRTGEYRGK
ncbi:MAG: metallophosphoesterase [Clostridiaceae bacterium]